MAPLTELCLPPRPHRLATVKPSPRATWNGLARRLSRRELPCRGEETWLGGSHTAKREAGWGCLHAIGHKYRLASNCVTSCFLVTQAAQSLLLLAGMMSGSGGVGRKLVHKIDLARIDVDSAVVGCLASTRRGQHIWQLTQLTVKCWSGLAQHSSQHRPPNLDPDFDRPNFGPCYRAPPCTVSDE